ncbi:Ubiquitin family protein [Coccidioides posadasii C735 delta SOWgp]|uniref:Ubiquitin family protein n=1 Tax=Coccidioides posadasii (strain C735) TaxID=222929 RepID=C5NZW1_COCP7|nr:Ubiquitin family protein [Coccidioides posadasii C735 delta SOWgp]EER30004.1 Ubiquitin family protein [Coccidioides posadasii C735 delta SOWgp]|eukprot:XP_003072149.1 Ubiquitin family protein [Coccidioides posadasii C735 delta SOWgp]
MADNGEVGEESPITFLVKTSSDAKYSLTLAPSTKIGNLKVKLSEPQYADVPPARQRLIYSGRVLKDHDTLATYNVKDGHTIHLVKSAASNQPPQQSSQSSSATTAGRSAPQAPPPGVPTNIAAGTGNNPLAGLTGARFAGYNMQLPGASFFGPDGGMGPPPSTEQLINMLDNPQFQSMMNEALQNPQLLDMMIQQNPMLRDMGPGVRQMMQSPAFRRMLTDPNMLRQMAQMQSQFGLSPFGGGSGENAAFPAPGVTNTTSDEHRQQENTQTGNTGNSAGNAPNPFTLFGLPPPPQGAAGNPFGALFGNAAFGGAPTGNSPAPTGTQENQPREGASTGTTAPSSTAEGTQPGQNQQNPFAALFNPALLASPPAGQTTSQQRQNPYAALANNPFLQDPTLFNQLMQAVGGGQNGSNAEAGANPFAALFPGLMGQGSSIPQDNRPPEERYAEQLRQLNEMGFYEFERNIEALRRTGGSVQGAVEYLLNNT